MRIITQQDIEQLNITPAECVDWVKESFSLKYDSQLPPKISIHPQDDDFINTMPCLLPDSYHRYGVKVVSRIAANKKLASTELLLDSQTGKQLALIQADWITTMRTGAVAALTAQLLRKSENVTYGFIGLGSTGTASVACLLDSEPEIHHHILLLRYKDQAEKLIEKMQCFTNVSFAIVDTAEELIQMSDVVISCITSAKGLICEKDELFKKGCLIIPVHTRGFQNCDLFFDKVYGDDYGHVCGFRYFNQFHQFAELSEVLLGKNPGRTTEDERILAYNIGLGLHDVFFANRIYDRVNDNCLEIEW